MGTYCNTYCTIGKLDIISHEISEVLRPYILSFIMYVLEQSIGILGYLIFRDIQLFVSLKCQFKLIYPFISLVFVKQPKAECKGLNNL